MIDMKYLVVKRDVRADFEYDEYYVASHILDILELTELTESERKALERTGFACLQIRSTQEVKTIIQEIRDKEAKKKKKAAEQRKKREEAKKLKQAQERILRKKLKEEQELELLKELKEKYE